MNNVVMSNEAKIPAIRRIYEAQSATHTADVMILCFVLSFILGVIHCSLTHIVVADLVLAT